MRFSSVSVAASRSRSALPPPCSSSVIVCAGLMFISPRIVRSARIDAFQPFDRRFGDRIVGEIGASG